MKKKSKPCPDCGHTMNHSKSEGWAGWSCAACGTLETEFRSDAPPVWTPESDAAIERVEKWMAERSRKELAGADYVTIRKAAGDGFLPAWGEIKGRIEAEIRRREMESDGAKVIRRGTVTKIDDFPDMMTIEQAVEYQWKSDKTLGAWADTGQLEGAEKVNKKWRIPRAALDAMPKGKKRPAPRKK